MPITAWNALYNTHIEEIDEQHRELVAVINALDALVTAGHDVAGLHDVLIELVGYAHRHLRFEEALMERVAFPELPRHRAIHAVFIEKVNALDIALRQGEHRQGQELLVFLHDWFLRHIRITDQEYVAHIAARHASGR